ncbi:N-acetylmannosamine-6-phosphate 2-epimerase [Streptomyces shenzhenensis]|uniref:N-acetylmannosamine-6-phosphate 2-epimerase n=1 Tax=Streptomyces shenzhenensis TaxID=943815 RepID=UPI0036AF8605
MNTVIKAIQSGLVVSCQAAEGNPLRGPQYMAAMARAAATGGAVGLRAEGPDDVAAVAQATGLPVIGILKAANQGPDLVYITPTYADAALVVAAGASIVAADGTARPRPDGQDLATLIRRIHDELGVPVMADVDSLESGRYAEQAGADVLGTTLAGYTGTGTAPAGPDLELLAQLVHNSSLPVIAEGKFWTPEDVTQAFALGAHAVVIGTAITNPLAITRRFVAAVPPRGAL